MESDKLANATGLNSSLEADDDYIRTPAATEFNNNDGYFRGLLGFHRKYDYIFKTHVLSCGGNSKYVSSRIENEIINTCNDLMLSD